MIKRHNILELIGRHAGKYRNCILTCYSLDFSFFEERVLPIFKTLNIKNINVFADGKFLEVAQEHTTGREFSHTKTYNFLPVYEKGVFHPKIMLLTGAKHGLLIIGSGNITSSGLSTNDEIWGAFHLNEIDNENAPLFAEVWLYLQQFIKLVPGIAQQKIGWVIKSSPWLLDLPKSNLPIPLHSINQTVSFVHNNSIESIFNQIQRLVPNKDVVTLTIISPYYDVNAEFINSFYSAYNPQTFNCVIDSKYGIIPKSIADPLKNAINFFEWKHCKKDYDEHYNRLHAKLFHFEMSDGMEYLMLGSANFTSAAMGAANKGAVNAEAGIVLMRRMKSFNWLNDLGITLSLNKKVDIDAIFSNTVSLLPKENPRRFITKIVYSELRGHELHIYLKDGDMANGFVTVFSNYAIKLESIPICFSDGKIIVLCSCPDEVFKICITDVEGVALTNYSIVHRAAYLLKCNPDPQQEKLNNLLEGEFPQGEGYTEMLQFVDYNWADEDENSGRVRANQFADAGMHAYEQAEDTFQILTAIDFNNVNDAILMEQFGELNNASVKIADFLQIVTSNGLVAKADNFEESMEQKLFEDTEQKGEGREIPESNKKKYSAETEKTAIETYFKKLDDHYHRHLKCFFTSKALTQCPKEKISLKKLSNILIALQLILLYWNKHFTIEKPNAKGEKYIIEGVYLEEGSFYSEITHVKSFMINVYGKFLILACSKFYEYPYEILSVKMIANRKLTFVKSLFIILNLTWIESEYHYRNTLLLNSLYFLNPEDINDEHTMIGWREQLDRMVLKSSFRADSYNDNHLYFFDKLLQQYKSWYNIFKNAELKKELIVDVDKSLNGQYIFNSKIGFNILVKHSYSVGKSYLTVKRDGYDWDEEDDDYLLKDLNYGNKIVLYK